VNITKGIVSGVILTGKVPKFTAITCDSRKIKVVIFAYAQKWQEECLPEKGALVALCGDFYQNRFEIITCRFARYWTNEDQKRLDAYLEYQKNTQLMSLRT